jgi:hypothetical protein
MALDWNRTAQRLCRVAYKRDYARQRTEPNADTAYFSTSRPDGRKFVRVSGFRKN